LALKVFKHSFAGLNISKRNKNKGDNMEINKDKLAMESAISF